MTFSVVYRYSLVLHIPNGTFSRINIIPTYTRKHKHTHDHLIYIRKRRKKKKTGRRRKHHCKYFHLLFQLS